MSNTLRIRLTPTDKEHTNIVGSIDVRRADDLPGILEAGGYLKVTRDNGRDQWVNLAHILRVEEATQGDPSVRVL